MNITLFLLTEVFIIGKYNHQPSCQVTFPTNKIATCELPGYEMVRFQKFVLYRISSNAVQNTSLVVSIRNLSLQSLLHTKFKSSEDVNWSKDFKHVFGYV